MVGTLNGCMGDTWTAAGNVFANTSTKSPKVLPGSPLPARNFEAPNFDSLGLMNFNKGNGGKLSTIPNQPIQECWH